MFYVILLLNGSDDNYDTNIVNQEANILYLLIVVRMK